MKYTEAQWYQHPSFRADLAKLLSDPVMVIALEIVKDAGAQSTNFATTATSLMEFFALSGAKKDGYREAIINLEGLSKPKPAKPEDRKAWDTPPKPPDSDRASAP
jgi:hypothetical protein